jgi:hypothetical protein
MALRFAALLALALGTAVSSSAAPAKPSSPFPIAAGDRWTLRDVDLGARRTISILRGFRLLELYGFPGLEDATGIRRKGTQVQVWSTTGQRWLTLLRFGPAGSRFRVDIPDSTLWRSVDVTVASTQAVVRDARGRVHGGCTRFTFRYHGLADTGLTDLTFAPGLGIVRVTEQSIVGPRTSLLESARIR